jgi:hypothetical protein
MLRAKAPNNIHHPSTGRLAVVPPRRPIQDASRLRRKYQSTLLNLHLAVAGREPNIAVSSSGFLRCTGGGFRLHSWAWRSPPPRPNISTCFCARTEARDGTSGLDARGNHSRCRRFSRDAAPADRPALDALRSSGSFPGAGGGCRQRRLDHIEILIQRVDGLLTS